MWWLFLTVLREQTNTIEHVNERVIRGAWSNFIIFGRRQARPFPIAFDLYTKLTKPAASCSFILQLVSIFSSKRRQMRIYSWERLNFKKKNIYTFKRTYSMSFLLWWVAKSKQWNQNMSSVDIVKKRGIMGVFLHTANEKLSDVAQAEMFHRQGNVRLFKLC